MGTRSLSIESYPILNASICEAKTHKFVGMCEACGKMLRLCPGCWRCEKHRDYELHKVHWTPSMERDRPEGIGVGVKKNYPKTRKKHEKWTKYG